MNRFLIRFLLFCAVLSGAGLVLFRYIGPTAAGLVFDAEHRVSPYHLIHFVRSRADDSAVDATLRSELVTAAAADGGQLVWRAEVIDRHEARTMHGSTWGHLAGIDMVRLERGGALVQIVTGSGFRALWDDPAREPVIAGTSVAPVPLGRGDTAVLVLFECIDAANPAPLGIPGESGWLTQLPVHGGHLTWGTPLQWIRGSQAWNNMAVLRFPDAAAAAAWLDDPVTLAERAIATQQLGDLLVLVASGSG